MKLASAFFALTLALPLMPSTAFAQNNFPAKPDTRPLKTFYLKYATTPNEANEILTDIRNILDPSVKIYLVPSRNAITIRAEPEQMTLAEQVLAQVDRPKPAYRLLYTLTEMDGGKRIGTQHVSIVLVSGQRTTLKQGSKIPVETGYYGGKDTPGAQTQMTYLDVGLNFDATLTGFEGGAELKSKVEQSGIAEEKSGVGPQDPVVRQTVIEGVALLAPGKPLILGSLDVPGSTRHLDVEVMMEPIK